MRIFLSKHWLKIELLAIFVILPAILMLVKRRMWIVLTVWATSAAAWLVLRRYYGYRWREEWNGAAVNKATVERILVRFIPYAIAMLLFTWGVVPEHLFSLPFERPRVWMMVMVLYPLLSVIPQEIIFRSFFMKRYAPLIPKSGIRMANALAFGWVHIIMQNWIAVSFCMIGGWLFADTYRRTRSLAAVCLEHALYGCYVFTIGLGIYFYHGNTMH